MAGITAINNKTVHLFTGNRNWINASTPVRVYAIAKNQTRADAYMNVTISIIYGAMGDWCGRPKIILLLYREEKNYNSRSITSKFFRNKLINFSGIKLNTFYKNVVDLKSSRNFINIIKNMYLNQFHFYNCKFLLEKYFFSEFLLKKNL